MGWVKTFGHHCTCFTRMPHSVIRPGNAGGGAASGLINRHKCNSRDVQVEFFTRWTLPTLVQQQCSLPVEYGRLTMSTGLYFFVNLQNSNIGPWAKKRTCFTGYFIPKLHCFTYAHGLIPYYILYYKRRAYIFSTPLYPVLILETVLTFFQPMHPYRARRNTC